MRFQVCKTLPRFCRMPPRIFGKWRTWPDMVGRIGDVCLTARSRGVSARGCAYRPGRCPSTSDHDRFPRMCGHGIAQSGDTAPRSLGMAALDGIDDLPCDIRELVHISAERVAPVRIGEGGSCMALRRLDTSGRHQRCPQSPHGSVPLPMPAPPIRVGAARTGLFPLRRSLKPEMSAPPILKAMSTAPAAISPPKPLSAPRHDRCPGYPVRRARHVPQSPLCAAPRPNRQGAAPNSMRTIRYCP